MSKAALKKELKTFTSEQLSEVILNVYDSSKEAKAYLEFFLNPDPDAFINDKLNDIFKELRRTKHGRVSKCRISVIRKAIKQGIDYGIAPEYIDRLMFGAISLIVSTEKSIYYPPTLFNGAYRLIGDYITWANKNGILASALSSLEKITADPRCGTEPFRRNIRWVIDTTIRNIKEGGL